MNKILSVKCPQCGTTFSYYESEFRPFCSERCKLIDLGHWFEESYRVPEKDRNQVNNNESEENDTESETFEQSYDEENESDYE